MANGEKLLKSLIEAPAISGYEENIREFMKKEFKKYCTGIRVDKIGNLIGERGKGSPKVLIMAHMDELGLMVKYIDKNGFINFEPIGGWDERILPAQKFKIYSARGKKPIIGVIGTKPIHILDKEEGKNIIKMKDMFIDTGAKSDKEVRKMGISVGDFITNYREYDRLIGSRMTGHGFDNRIGCYILLEIMRKLKNFKGTAYFVGTIQEELGLIGARGSIFGINPDVVLGVDVTIAGDAPDIRPVEASMHLGKGPILGIKDAVSIIDPYIKRWILETAKKAKIDVQLEVTTAGATDASVAPLVREGIPSGVIFVPCRYIHTPVEVADMKDVEKTIELSVECIRSASRYFG